MDGNLSDYFSKDGFNLRSTSEGEINQLVNIINDAYAKNNNYETIDLDYMSLAPWLKKYYEKYGFIETGEVTPRGLIDLVRMQKKVSR